MKLRTSFYNHFLALGFLIFGAVLTVLALYWFNFAKAAILIFGISFAIGAIPALFLHFEYYLQNKGEIYEISSNCITFYKAGTEQTYGSEEITKVIVYKSANMDAWGLPIGTMENYYYARIITHSGEELIITRLLTPEVEKAVRQLKGVPIERVKRPFCPVFWKRLGNPDI